MQSFIESLWGLFLKAVDVFLHLDKHLNELATNLGGWLYGVLFLVIFAETGLVIMPFLPGDSLLFAIGALAALPDSTISFPLIMILLLVAAIIGDATNYAIGKRIGARIYTMGDRWWLKQDHLRKTHDFYEKYGGKTIILARFIPIIRTFAPFVAGVGTMTYRKFSYFNVVGAIAWVVSFLSLGYFFGNLPAVKSNFHYVIVGIIVISVMPGVVAYVNAKKSRA